jgi:DNA-binding transcriptional LysR family regulator
MNFKNFSYSFHSCHGNPAALEAAMNSGGKRIDLNLLVVFEAIYGKRNLTAAGETLGLSQPAMSHALSRLRQLYEDALFVRLPRGLHPTPYAEKLARSVATGLDAIRGTLARLEFEPRASTRVFRLAMTDIGEQVFLPALTRHLSAAAPGVSVQTVQIPVKDLEKTMASGDVDLALGFIPQLRTGFYQQRLFRDSYASVARAEHPQIRGSLTLQQYRQAGHALVFSAGTGHGQVIERVLQRKDVRGRVALRITHFLALPAIVASTDLIATLPKNLAVSFAAFPKIRIFTPPVDFPAFDVKQYWHERFHREPGHRWLRGLIGKLFLHYRE